MELILINLILKGFLNHFQMNEKDFLTFLEFIQDIKEFHEYLFRFLTFDPPF